MPKGKRVGSSGRRILLNVYKYFDDLGKRSKTSAPLKRTAIATGQSVSTVKRVRLEAVSGSTGDFSSPKNRYSRSRRLEIDTFDREAIRRKIYQMYENKNHVTLTNLLVSNICILIYNIHIHYKLCFFY